MSRYALLIFPLADTGLGVPGHHTLIVGLAKRAVS
jgi:hypothetical protein